MPNKQVIIDQVACSLQINHGPAYQIIPDDLGFNNLCKMGVLRDVTASTGANVLKSDNVYLTATTMKAKYYSRILTGDEMWVHYDDLEFKRQYGVETS